VRYYGLFSHRQQFVLAQLRQRLLLVTSSTLAGASAPASTPVPTAPLVMNCPVCGQPMQVSVLHPVRSRGPPAAQGGARVGNIPRQAAVGVVWPLGRGVPQV